jgi:hypothetical protein
MLFQLRPPAPIPGPNLCLWFDLKFNIRQMPLATSVITITWEWLFEGYHIHIQAQMLVTSPQPVFLVCALPKQPSYFP